MDEQLHQRLLELTFDLRQLDLGGFRRWLDSLLGQWRADPVFCQRALLRDLRRDHPELRQLETEWRRVTRANAASAEGVRLALLDRQRRNVDRAIDGLDDAISHATTERRPSLELKRKAFRERRQRLDEELAEINSMSFRQQELRIADELQRARERTGYDREEARLSSLLRNRGQRSDRAGKTFEEEAASLAREQMPCRPEAVWLRSARLGAAGVELDLLLVNQTHADEPVEVLAIVEIKRNINDLAHGFRRRQIDLAWLTGDLTAYDPKQHRTGHFVSGHFDRPAVHWQDDRSFLFGPESFRHFVRDSSSGHFMNGLYLATRVGPIWGVSGAALSRIAHRIATDDRWDPLSQACLAELFELCRSLARPIETPDVLALYASRPEWTRQLMFIKR